VIDFDLPKNLIAQMPAQPRDHARLLVYRRKDKTIADDYFYNLINYLPSPTLLVANNSKVEKCRMLFNGGKKEIFVIEAVNDRTVRALVRPGRQFRLNDEVQLTKNVSVKVTNIDQDGIRTLKFNAPRDHKDLMAAQHVPLPPYIAQNDELGDEYQTIYAKSLGSKAAPTAGLHFTDELKRKVQTERDWAEVTLHVSLGTFAGLTAKNFETGKLHEEIYEVSEAVYQKIEDSEHVTAVGTTSVRTIESIFNPNRQSSHQGPSLKGGTDIFIRPGYKFNRVNSLITNFHLPGTSLLLLVEAFVGSESEMKRIYEHAIEQKYRFYSFGDAMLLV
jgi:S-adenosylmethionine:tRNA ribosyltransferase-isomerase